MTPLPPPSVFPPSRMLRVEFKGQPYDWFNLDEIGDLARSEDFAHTLRENIWHYFSVPFDYQAIFDEDGMLSSAPDFSRSLRGQSPCIRVLDVREMRPDAKEQALHRLASVAAEVARCQQMLSTGRSVSPWARQQRLAASPPKEPVMPGMAPSVAPVAPPVVPPVAPYTPPPPGMRLPYAMPPARPVLPSSLVAMPNSWGPLPPALEPRVAPTLAHPAAWPPDCVEVALAKDAGDSGSRFGFANVSSADGRQLLVTWVDANGLLGRWNLTHPERAVREGSLICAVNGVSEDVEAMRVQLQQDTVRMLVRQSGRPLLGGLP